MGKEKKEKVEEDYQFKLLINRKNNVNTVCLRFFKSLYGLRDDIDEATEECMDMIYSDILSKEKLINTEKNYDTSIIFAVYYKKILVREIIQFLPKNRKYVKINIKGIIPEIIKNLRAKHEKK
jgi:hypothetical protein